MHSNKMRTGRLLTVSRSARGVCPIPPTACRPPPRCRLPTPLNADPPVNTMTDASFVGGNYQVTRQDSVGCIPTACQLSVFQWPPLDISTGGEGVGPQDNKFVQVSSDDHQMSDVQGVRYNITYPMMHVMCPPPPQNRMADACETRKHSSRKCTIHFPSSGGGSPQPPPSMQTPSPWKHTPSSLDADPPYIRPPPPGCRPPLHPAPLPLDADLFPL